MRRFIAHLLFYPTLAWNLLLNRIRSRWDWWNRVDDHLIVGAFPFASVVPELEREGVKAVVNTCEEYAGPVAAYQAAGIEQLHIPTIDFTPPRLADIERGVEFIQRHATAGDTVYVHCKAGRGRSATVALCWLVAYRGLTPAAAQELLNARRPQVLKSVYQRDVVREFTRKHGHPSPVAKQNLT